MRSPHLTTRTRRAAYALAALAVSTALTACEPGLDPQGAGPNPTSGPTAASAAPTQPQDTSTPDSVTSTAPSPAASADPVPATSQPAATSAPSATPSSEPSPQPTAPAVPAGLETFYNQEISWEACADGAANAQCATVSVPLDYDDPTGTTISIALRRQAASDGEAENGALFLNPGGPGVSGTAFVSAIAPGYTPEMLASYDLIGFDPRGTGDSTHLTCWAPEESAPSGTEDTGSTGAGDVEVAPGDEDDATEDADLSEATAVVENNRAAGSALAAACRQYSEVPDLIDHMSTVETARDLDVLRAVVGEDDLDYLGYSYGTELGATYAALFPDNVGRTVLDSAVDISMTRDQAREEQMATREGRVRQYLEYCLGQEGCPLTGSVDEATAQLVSFIASVASEPLAMTVDGQAAQMDSMTLHNNISNLALAREEYWPALTRALNAAMTQRDATELARVAALAPDTGQQDTTPDSEAVRVANAAYSAVTCTDDPVEGDAAAWAQDLLADLQAYPFTTWFIGSSSLEEAYCQGMGLTARPLTTELSPTDPVVVIGVTGDPQTPYAWSQTLDSQFGTSHLLTVTGFQHGATGINSCATVKVSEFLVTGQLPAEEEVCPIDPLPEATAEALAQ